MRWYGKRLNALHISVSKRVLKLVSSSYSSRRERPWAITKVVEILKVLVEDHITDNPTKYTCPHFSGREEYLRQLALFFKPRNKDDVPSRREFLLYGLGGAVKTQICLKFAEKHSKLYRITCDRDPDKCYMLTFGFLSRVWKVFWVDATNQETLELSFQEIGFDEVAKRDGLDGSIESVKRWLSRAQKEWLLTLDNADGDSAILDDYIPNGGRGNILFSSRNPSLLHGYTGSRMMGQWKLVHWKGVMRSYYLERSCISMT